MTIVAKFGGSSLADAAQIKKVVAIVKANPDRRVVVVSAPGKRDEHDIKITDLLGMWHRQVRNVFPQNGLTVIRDRFRRIVFELKLSIDIERELQDIANSLNAGAAEDYAMSRGEYLCAKIVAEALGYEFLDAASCICFDEKGRYGRGDEAIRAAVGDRRVVIPGFYGVMPDGAIKTFSRGGSDLTGALVARALHAVRYENWTDVVGLRMADPKIVPHARLIRALSYKEMRELAYMGASVLHEEAMFPGQEAGIETHILCTNAPEEPGTIITKSLVTLGAPERMVTGIAGKPGFVAITIAQMLMDQQIGFGRKILSLLEELGISFEHMPGGVDYLTLTIAKKSVSEQTLWQLMERLRGDFPGLDVEFRIIAHVVVVGRGMVNHPGVLERAAGALRRGKINVLTVNQGVPQTSITFGIDQDDCAGAISALYEEFQFR